MLGLLLSLSLLGVDAPPPVQRPTVSPPLDGSAPSQPEPGPPEPTQPQKGTEAPPSTAPAQPEPTPTPDPAPPKPDVPVEPGAQPDPTPADPDAPTEPDATEADAPTEPAEPNTTEPAPACPCDPIDWKCMQANAAACPSGEERPEPEHVASDYEMPPRTPPRREPAGKPGEREGPQRTGFIVGGGIGYLGCRTAYACEDIFKGAFTAEGELGYRWRFVAPVIVVGGGRGRVEVPPEIQNVKARLGFLDVGAGVMIFPAPRSIFDPYFGLTLGVAQSKIRASDTLGQGAFEQERTTRGGARFAFGLNFFLSPRVTLGPRFTISVPFAGKWCLSGNPPLDGDGCVKIKDLAEEALIDPAELPRNFAITLHLRLILPVT